VRRAARCVALVPVCCVASISTHAALGEERRTNWRVFSTAAARRGCFSPPLLQACSSLRAGMGGRMQQRLSALRSTLSCCGKRRCTILLHLSMHFSLFAFLLLAAQLFGGRSLCRAWLRLFNLRGICSRLRASSSSHLSRRHVHAGGCHTFPLGVYCCSCLSLSPLLPRCTTNLARRKQCCHRRRSVYLNSSPRTLPRRRSAELCYCWNLRLLAHAGICGRFSIHAVGGR